MRAEPVAAKYSQGEVHHADYFEKLEEQMTEWEPDKSKGSPDRIDALVYAVTELFGLDKERDQRIDPYDFYGSIISDRGRRN